MQKIVLAILGPDKKLIGFKQDTFWSIGKEWGKLHSMNYNNQIDTHLVPNLLGTLTHVEDGVKQGIPTYLGQTELYIAVYLYNYPESPEGMKAFVQQTVGLDQMAPVILYKLYKLRFNSNGVNHPWTADIDLEGKPW